MDRVEDMNEEKCNLVIFLTNQVSQRWKDEEVSIKGMDRKRAKK